MEAHFECFGCGSEKGQERLYSCDNCSSISCTSCCVEEIISAFCIYCSKDYPVKDPLPSRSRCRECSLCPICSSLLSVAYHASSSSYLTCTYCHWNSREQTLTNTKDDKLSLTKVEEKQVAQFNSIDAFFKTLTIEQELRKGPPTATDLKSFDDKQNQQHNHHHQLQHKIVNDSQELYVDLNEWNPKSATNLDQRLFLTSTQPSNERNLQARKPQLRAKMSKKCPKCLNLLIKPEQKQNSIKFNILKTALAIIPTVSIAKPPTLPLPTQGQSPSKMIVRFTNPQESQVNVSIEIKHEIGIQLTCELKNFIVSPKDTLLDYKEEDEIKPSEKSTTIYEKKENFVSIVMFISQVSKDVQPGAKLNILFDYGTTKYTLPMVLKFN